jgi:hypothetical protein
MRMHWAMGCEAKTKFGLTANYAGGRRIVEFAGGDSDSKARPIMRGGLPSASRSLVQELLAIFCGAGSAHLAEHSCKVLLRFEAASHRDIQDTHLGCAQHLLRTLYPMAENKLMWALTG